MTDMPERNIIIAMDSFKGCMSSSEANEAVRQGVLTVLPDAEVHCIPIADGGEGWMAAIAGTRCTRTRTVVAHHPRMRPMEASYLVSDDGKQAFIEMATCSGLTLLPEDERDPMETTTYGTGELVRHALRNGCREIVIGLGGSATNDAGLGMMQALGMRTYNHEGVEIHDALCGKNMAEIRRIDLSSLLPEAKEATFTLACDVKNPFCGTEGAAFVYAPQKGASHDTVLLLEEGLQHIALVFKEVSGKDCRRLPGAGAAGGMGGGLWSLLDATLLSGIELLLRSSAFDTLLTHADLVITGEGRSDAQTLMGKAAYGILQHAQKAGVPVALLSGQTDDMERLLQAGFRSVQSIHPIPLPLHEAMQPDVARRHLAHSTALLFEDRQTT